MLHVMLARFCSPGNSFYELNQFNILHKIFNKKTLNISYSYTNIKEKVNTHNTEVIRKYYDQINSNNKSDISNDNCNCKTKINCPMNGLCNLNNVLYQAIIF